MKKKLLSLVLAGAMVASTSVSAFADGEISQTPSTATNPQEFTVTNTEADANIGIEGRIANGQNELPPSTISVTVPTSATFTVDKNGTLIGANINITSNSDTAVKVIAHKFKDATGESNIHVVDSQTLAGENAKEATASRKKVSLKLIGEDNSVSLKTSEGTGICALNANDENIDENKKVLGTVKTGKSLNLSLQGEGVTAKQAPALDKAVSDTFTLTLKLKKA